ncbi:molybdate ABC transporter substrate-binding protein [Jannaschia sp. KMU-145]|uniref:molybdate ABC transporter substrate-binding protein n=1 Tax=Jannaschia halovivens TaxID=3388667 RepID=UPI00396AF826
MTAPRLRSRPTRRSLLGAAAVLAAPRLVHAEAGLVILAAASLKPALDAVLDRWDGPVRVSYLGSGAAARQVAAGAPVDLVILAAVDWMDWLAGQGVLAGPPVPLAGNRLILAGPPGSAPLTLDRAEVLDRLGDGRFAIGDPMSVPAGRYGQQALETLGLWDAIRPRAVLTENVRAALAHVVRGDLAMGVVYGSDAEGSAVATLATFPRASHAPITYPAAIPVGAGPGAAALRAHIAAASDIFAAKGFAPAPIA